MFIKRLLVLQNNVRIVIIDNNSTYEPLIKYYKEIEGIHEVLRMDKNYGHTVIRDVLWKDEKFKEKYNLMNENYVYSDCDVIPDKNCPKNFLDKFEEILNKTRAEKVGFSLRIDNLPDYYKNKKAVIEWETQFWKRKIDNTHYLAPIDTTFALRRKGTCAGHTGNSIRTASPYIAEHLTWYINCDKLNAEDKFYYNSIKTSTHWSGKIITKKEIQYKIYQIYYNEISKKRLSPIFEPYDNSTDKSLMFFENNVIVDIYNKLDTIKADYIGTTSWKFSEKTRMGAVEFTEAIKANINTNDVILFPIQKHMNENCVQRNKVFYTPLYKLMEMFDNKNILPFKMLTDKWTCSYCNYWLAKKQVYKDYCKKALIPAMKAFMEDKEIIDFNSKHKSNHGGNHYSYTPFLLELLMGYFVNKFNIPHVVITPNEAIRLKENEVWCEVLNKALVPEGITEVKFKREFAEQLQASGYVKII